MRKDDRVRVRIGNLTMTNHPIHLHGHEFAVTGTDGGPIAEGGALAGGRPPTSRSDRCASIEFVADEEGDWAFHCHKRTTR